MLEALRGSIDRHEVILLGSALMLAGALVVTKEYIHQTPEDAYERKYTADGQCLDNSPFDTDSGATAFVREYNGVDILSIVPAVPETYTPAVLNFTVTNNGVFIDMNPELSKAGYITGEFLAETCNETYGY